MNVKKIITTTTNEELNILGATLLSDMEAISLLTKGAREYPRYWWLRTTGYSSDHVCYVDGIGLVNYLRHSTVHRTYTVRPALVLSDIADTNWSVGDIFELRGYKFKILSPTLAWMFVQNIGSHCFDTKTSIYEESSIKIFVDEWFENLINEV